MRESAKALSSTAPADAFAELKRLQDELQEEIPPLKEKIRAELQPQQRPGAGAPVQSSSPELEQGITLLQGWADTAGENMSSASLELNEPPDNVRGRRASKSAIGELEKIWEAVIPFQPPARPRPGGPDANRREPLNRPRRLQRSIRSPRVTSRLTRPRPIETSRPRNQMTATAGDGRPSLDTDTERSGAARRIAGTNSAPDAITETQGRGRARSR